MRKSKRFHTCIALFLFTAMMLTLTASAAYYNTYTSVAALPDVNSCAQSQGFVVGATYAYSVKTKSDYTKASIYRIKMSDGTRTLMTNGDNGTTYNTYLGHANDMIGCTIGGQYHLFIVTMKAGSSTSTLVKLRYSGTTYYKVGEYTINYNGVEKGMSGIKITGTDANNIYFLFKSAKELYRGTLPLTANSGTINTTYAFNLNVVDALVNGSTVPGIETFSNQGLGYYNNSIYVPLTEGNVSIVLVYRNISTASGTITADPNLSFRITSSAYPDSFEIEGCGVASDGKLWFSVNRRITETDGDHDAVCYFDGYTAS